VRGQGRLRKPKTRKKKTISVLLLQRDLRAREATEEYEQLSKRKRRKDYSWKKDLPNGVCKRN